jgi:sarcosine oxidase, subunit beta
VTTVVDAVVIGSGVMGSAVAYELARNGFQVMVVDKGGGVGQGSTSASSAIIRFNYSTFEGVAVAWESFHCWTSWGEHLEAEAGAGLASLCRTGVVLLDVPVVPRERSGTLFDRAGVPHEWWDADTLRDRIPGLDPGRHWPPKRIEDAAFWADPAGELGGVFTPHGGFVDDPMLAARNLADAAVRRGVRFLHRRTVTAVRRAGARVTGVTLADGERVDAPVVVNCAGPWSARVNALAGVGADFTIDVRPMRQEVHQVTAPAGYNDADRLGPVVFDIDLGTYLRATPGDGMLIGGTEPDCDPLEWIDDPDRFDPQPTVARFEAQVTRAARRFPRLRVPTRPKGIAGVYDAASDWTPIYDRTDLDGFYVAMGTSGNQFKNAPMVGRMMATLITAIEGGRDHDAEPVTYDCPHTGHAIDLAAFSRKRPLNADSTGTVMG